MPPNYRSPGRRRRFVVVGAYVVDCFVRTPRMPRWGEELLADAIRTVPGGKALNQATVLARNGVHTTAIGAVGDDAAGRNLCAVLTGEQVETSAMLVHPTAPTATCLVFTHADGRNAIVWRIPEALVLTPAAVRAAEPAIRDADVVMLTTEIPSETIRVVIDVARSAGTRVVVNPALPLSDPAAVAALPWQDVDVLVPNESEARTLLPADHPAREGPAVELPCAVSAALGVAYVCVTLAERGCATWDGRRTRAYAAHPTTVVDVTGAGDAFTTTLALHLLDGVDQDVAVDRALAAAAVTVSRPGAYESLPRASPPPRRCAGVD